MRNRTTFSFLGNRYMPEASKIKNSLLFSGEKSPNSSIGNFG
jgi:hypothetical protein